ATCSTAPRRWKSRSMAATWCSVARPARKRPPRLRATWPGCRACSTSRASCRIRRCRVDAAAALGAFPFDRAPADVVAVELAGPGDAGDFGVGLALGVGHADAQGAHA